MLMKKPFSNLQMACFHLKKLGASNSHHLLLHRGASNSVMSDWASSESSAESTERSDSQTLPSWKIRCLMFNQSGFLWIPKYWDLVSRWRKLDVIKILNIYDMIHVLDLWICSISILKQIWQAHLFKPLQILWRSGSKLVAFCEPTIKRGKVNKSKMARNEKDPPLSFTFQMLSSC